MTFTTHTTKDNIHYDTYKTNHGDLSIRNNTQNKDKVGFLIHKSCGYSYELKNNTNIESLVKSINSLTESELFISLKSDKFFGNKKTAHLHRTEDDSYFRVICKKHGRIEHCSTANTLSYVDDNFFQYVKSIEEANDLININSSKPKLLFKTEILSKNTISKIRSGYKFK